MPREVKVSDIKANLLRPATTSHFEVEIPLPGRIGSPAREIFKKWEGVGKQDKIQLMCSEASLPGSNLATFDINNDRTGVTEKHVHRRIFDDRIDLTFYVDAGLYQPIKFFEEWMDYITGGSDSNVDIADPSYFYRMRYPDDYIAQQGLSVIKFEKDQQNWLKYRFVNVFPMAINSMPVSYEASSLLKVTVSMSYIRYYIENLEKQLAYKQTTPLGQARFNASGLAAGIVDAAVDRLTGNDLLGDIAGGFAGRFVQQQGR